MSPVTYVRNFELHLYGSWERTRTENKLNHLIESNYEAYVGAGVCAYLANIAWFPYPLRIGAKYLYNPIHPELSGVSGILSVDM